MAKRDITDFFKSSKKKNAIKPSIETKSATDQFYSMCLSEKFENCKNSTCSKEKNDLKVKCAEQEEKLKEIYRAIEICLGVSREKEKKIECLLSKIKTTEKASKPVACFSKSLDINNIFSTFENVFTHDELAKLRSVEHAKKDDSTFVLKSIRFLYKDDVKTISSLSVTGRSRGAKPKQKMCQTKYDIIKKLFMERLTVMELNSAEFIERSKQINTLMKNAFTNTKHHGNQTDDDEMMRRINEKVKQSEMAPIQ